MYKTNTKYKNDWLIALHKFFDDQPMIVGGLYFNIDLTNGMSRRVHGEQDWSVLDPITEKVYDGIFNVLDGATENRTLTSSLRRLFGKEFMIVNGKKVLIETIYKKQINEIIKLANIQPNTPMEKAI